MSKWPQHHDDELRKLHGEGHTFGEIAEKISAKFHVVLSRNACIGRALRIGLTRNVARLCHEHSPQKATRRARAAIAREEVKRTRRELGDVGPAPAPRRRARYSVAPEKPETIPSPPFVKRETAPAGSIASRVMTAIRKEPPREEDARPMRCAAVEPLHLSIMDLAEDTCRWPYGGWPERTGITFCGHTPAPGKPYCAAHQELSCRRTHDNLFNHSASQQAAHRKAMIPALFSLSSTYGEEDAA